MRKNIVMLINCIFEIVKKIKDLLRLLQNFNLIMRHQKKLNLMNTTKRTQIVVQ